MQKLGWYRGEESLRPFQRGEEFFYVFPFPRRSVHNRHMDEKERQEMVT